MSGHVVKAFHAISGEELKKIIKTRLSALSDALDRQPVLMEHVSYPRFSLKITIEVLDLGGGPGFRLEDAELDDVVAPQALREAHGLPKREVKRGTMGSLVDDIVQEGDENVTDNASGGSGGAGTADDAAIAPELEYGTASEPAFTRGESAEAPSASAGAGSPDDSESGAKRGMGDSDGDGGSERSSGRLPDSVDSGAVGRSTKTRRTRRSSR